MTVLGKIFLAFRRISLPDIFPVSGRPSGAANRLEGPRLDFHCAPFDNKVTAPRNLPENGSLWRLWSAKPLPV